MLYERSLAPAELPKQAASFDLPISLGILAASGQFQSDKFTQYAAVGELALEGHMRPIKGALSMAISARDAGYKGLLVPSANAGEAAVVSDIEIISVPSLSEAVGFFTGMLEIQPHPSQLQELFAEYSRYDLDFADVRGQEVAKRALTIAAADTLMWLPAHPSVRIENCLGRFRRGVNSQPRLRLHEDWGNSSLV